QHRSGVLVERYARGLGLDLCTRLGLFDAVADAPRSVVAIRDACGFVRISDRPLRWLLEHARYCGVLSREGADTYRLIARPPQPALADLRAAGLGAGAPYGAGPEPLGVAG